MKEKENLPKEWREKAEDWVRGYYFYQQQLKEAREQILYSTPIYDNNGGGKSNLPSRPTEKKAMELIKINENTRKLIRRVKAVETALGELNTNRQRLIYSIYWSGASQDVTTICLDLSITKATYHRWNTEFLKRVWGLLEGD